MGSQKSVEWISGPGKVQCAFEPTPGRWLVHEPPIVRHEVGRSSAVAQPEPASLHQESELQEARGRCTKAARTGRQRTGAPVTRVNPQEGVRVQQDHRRLLRGTKASPSPSPRQVHPPFSTAGSMASTSEARRARASGGRRTSSSNCTPRRSITTRCPCSAASSRSAKCWRAAAADILFMCTMYKTRDLPASGGLVAPGASSIHRGVRIWPPSKPGQPARGHPPFPACVRRKDGKG
jgi:hypothetical protein